METEDQSMVTKDGEETVAKVTRCGTKLSSHTAKLSNTQERRTALKTSKKDSITIQRRFSPNSTETNLKHWRETPL